MKILYLSDAQSIHTIRWAEWARESGNEVHIASFRENSIKGVTVHKLSTFGLGKLGYIMAIPRLRKLFRGIKPDIVHAQYVTSYGLLASVTNMHPLVVTAWGSDVLTSPKESILSKYLVKYALSRADKITTVAEHMNKAIEEYSSFKKKPIAIPMGVDLEEFPFPVSQRTSVPPLKIISTRGFKPVYDVRTILDAVRLVKDAGLQVHLDLVGEGPLKKQLESHVNYLGIQDIVTFHGKVKFSQLKELLSDAHVFISSSHSDGNNVSLNEAMALGCFPIATNIPANQQWITHEDNGLLYDSGNALMLSGMLKRFYCSGTEFDKVAKKNRELIAEFANWKSNTEKMWAIYSELAMKNAING